MLSRKWEVRRRLEFIEERLFWDGRVNRADLVQKFQISLVQAAKDLADYQQCAPGNMVYDGKVKCYLPSPHFQPRLISLDVDKYLQELESTENIPLEKIQMPLRTSSPVITQKVFGAIRDRKDLEVRYQSLSRPAPVLRWISPHALISDGLRWHVRAFCHLDGFFKDFLLARILEVVGDRSQTVSAVADAKWSRLVDVVIGPHPELTKEQQQVVERDYGMQDGQLSLKVREACLLYMLRRLGLWPEEKDPSVQQIVWKNKLLEF